MSERYAEERPEPFRRGGGAIAAALLVGAGGLALCALGFASDPRQALFSWLAAWVYGLTIALGALIFVMIGHVTAAGWFVALRRLTETIAASLPLFALLFLPLALGLEKLYPWVAPAPSLDARSLELIAHRRPYLNVPFFLGRAALYFAIWGGVAALLRRWSLRQDEAPAPALTARSRALAAGAMPPVGLALAFASFDWIMSLTTKFESSIFGVYTFAGAILAALALVVIASFLARRAGLLPAGVSASHDYALGRLLLTFVVFWAYIAFSQLVIVWLADLPEELGWYRARFAGSWAPVGVFLLVGHFAMPFLLLLSYRLKRRAAALAAVAAWLLFAHYVDVYWLVLPALHEAGARPHWLDLAALAGVIGPATAFTLFRLRGHALVPKNDPALAASLRYAA
jgi:hypothetical protein